jgi:hypothetical protein
VEREENMVLVGGVVGRCVWVWILGVADGFEDRCF